MKFPLIMSIKGRALEIVHAFAGARMATSNASLLFDRLSAESIAATLCHGLLDPANERQKWIARGKTVAVCHSWDGAARDYQYEPFIS
jgi:hypothetical protein